MPNPVMLTESSPHGSRLTEAPTAGRFLLKIIDVGEGSSGYYSPETLQLAAADRVFPAGTHCYVDHAAAIRRGPNGERSIRDLAAVLTEDARYDETLKLCDQTSPYGLTGAVFSRDRYAFIKANWHKDIVDRALEGFTQLIPASQVDVFDVPGAFEMPMLARDLAQSGRYAAVAAAADDNVDVPVLSQVFPGRDPLVHGRDQPPVRCRDQRRDAVILPRLGTGALRPKLNRNRVAAAVMLLG